MTFVFDSYCRKNNIRYSLCAGSLLGAVRHHGIIPWDDDVDVMVPRPDYNRLLELSKTDFPKGFSIIHAGNTDHYYLPLAKMTNLNTGMIEMRQNMECPVGINIDIFPVDVIPEDAQKANEVYNRFMSDYEKASVAASYTHFQSPFVEGKFRLRTVLHYFRNHIFRSIYNSGKIFERMDKSISEENWEQGQKARIYSSYQYHNRLFDKSIFDEYIDIEFNGLKVMCIKDYDIYLTILFKDYMKLPPVEKQVCHHHHYFLDMDRGYSNEELRELGVIDN
jgi:lipopolysaccharide cholinephosphotransferase